MTTYRSRYMVMKIYLNLKSGHVLVEFHFSQHRQMILWVKKPEGVRQNTMSQNSCTGRTIRRSKGISYLYPLQILESA